jgi:hypothetical protein
MRFARSFFIATLLTLAGPLLAASPPVTEIATPAAAGSAEPFLFAIRDGLLLSWLEPVGNTKESALRFAVYRNGKWSAPVTVAQRGDFFVNWADFPSIVQDENGVLFAHWLQKSGESGYAYDVRVAISKDDGRTWSGALLLNTDGKKGEHGFVSLAPLPGGGVGAAWLDGRNMVEGKEEGEMTVRYATIDAAGTIRSGVQLDDRTCECCTTGMATAGGRPVIAYRDRSGDETRDIAVVRQTANGWSKPRLVHGDGWKIAGCPVNGPQLDARGKRVAAAWFTAAGERGRAYVAFSDDAGATFGAPIVVDDGKPIGRMDVAMLDAESAVVTWSEQTAAGAELRARRVPRNGRPGPSIKVADSTAARGSGFARAATLGQDVYVAWTEQNGTTKQVHVSRVRPRGKGSGRCPVTGRR